MRSHRFLRPRPIGLTLPVDNSSTGAKPSFRLPFQGVWDVSAIGGGGGGCSRAEFTTTTYNGGAGENGSHFTSINFYTNESRSGLMVIGSGGARGDSASFETVPGSPGTFTKYSAASTSGGDGGVVNGDPEPDPSPFPGISYRSIELNVSLIFLGVSSVRADTNFSLQDGQGGRGRFSGEGVGNGTSGRRGAIMYVLKG